MDTRTDAAGESAGWLPPTGPPFGELPPAAPGSTGAPQAALAAPGSTGAPGWVPSAPSSAGWQAPPAPRPGRALPAPRNEIARWARICAIVSVLFNPLLLVSITAIVLGIIGLHRSEQPPFAGRFDSGRRQALTGIGIGVLGLLLSILFVVLFALSLAPRMP